MHIDISKLPPGFKLELTKEDLIAFADYLLEQRLNNAIANAVEEQPIDVGAVADLLKVSKQHVYFMTSQNKIPHTKAKNGKRLYFFRSEILKWLKSGKRKTDEEIDDMANEFLERSRTKRK